MDSFSWTAHSETETDTLGQALAECLPFGCVVALSGTLGAGKTRLVKALAASYGIHPEDVISPTFVLMQRYEGRVTLYHFDVYRIKDDDEFLELGPEEYFDSEAITLLEWAERVENCLPLDYIQISIDVIGDHSRTFTVQAVGSQFKAVPQRVQLAIDQLTG